MKPAFVLINCDLGYEESVISHIKSIDGVKEVKSTFGIYDILAKIESEKPETVRQTITDQIRKLDHVKSTLTLLCIEDTDSIWQI